MTEPNPDAEPAHAAPVDDATGDLVEAEVIADPEPVELSDGSRLEFVRDLVQYGYAEDPANRPETHVPFAVRITRPDGSVSLVSTDVEADTHRLFAFVIDADKLGYRRS